MHSVHLPRTVNITPGFPGSPVRLALALRGWRSNVIVSAKARGRTETPEVGMRLEASLSRTPCSGPAFGKDELKICSASAGRRWLYTRARSRASAAASQRCSAANTGSCGQSLVYSSSRSWNVGASVGAGGQSCS
jgi:hypothetical protein